jgi:hypothetical protein
VKEENPEYRDYREKKVKEGIRGLRDRRVYPARKGIPVWTEYQDLQVLQVFQDHPDRRIRPMT